MGKIISKSFGENDYKGFILLKNHKTGKISRHYISAVNSTFNKDRVSLYVRNGSSDTYFDYKMGSNKKADIGIKTWVKERKRKKMRVDSDLPKVCYDFVGKSYRRK